MLRYCVDGIELNENLTLMVVFELISVGLLD
jgi:hypothetical protein